MRGVWRKIFYTTFLFGTALIGWFGLAYYESYNFAAKTAARVVLPHGTGVAEIGEILYQQGLINNPMFFKFYSRITEQGHKLKAGEYEIPAGSRMPDIVSLLASGKTIRYAFTIPEGYTIFEVCDKLAKQNFMPLATCDALVHDTSFLREPASATTLEGYLFPETYLFDKLTTPPQMIQAMVDQFYNHVTDDVLQKVRERGLTVHRWVTFASLVEKETGVAFERPLIAGVFYNRLQVGMLLQTDPSVIYGVKNFDGNLTRKHLETDTTYNTYTRNGLPIGPIANPGWESLQAVLSPFATEAYYFVAKGGGQHYFSKNLTQHNRAVQYYIFKNGAQPEPGEEAKMPR